MILKYSCLNAKCNLVKYVDQNRYGVYNKATSTILIPAENDYIGMQDGAVIAQKGEVFFKINLGDSTYTESKNFVPNFYFFKNDRCPICAGSGCPECAGFGFIPAPINGYPLD